MKDELAAQMAANDDDPATSRRIVAPDGGG